MQQDLFQDQISPDVQQLWQVAVFCCRGGSSDRSGLAMRVLDVIVYARVDMGCQSSICSHAAHSVALNITVHLNMGSEIWDFKRAERPLRPFG